MNNPFKSSELFDTSRMPLWAEAQLGGSFTPCGLGWAALFRRVRVTVMAARWAMAAGGGSQLKRAGTGSLSG